MGSERTVAKAAGSMVSTALRVHLRGENATDAKGNEAAEVAKLMVKSQEAMIQAMRKLPAELKDILVYVGGNEVPLKFVRHTNRSGGKTTPGGWVQHGVLTPFSAKTYISPTAVVLGNKDIMLINAKIYENAVVDGCGLMFVTIGKGAHLVGSGKGSELFFETIHDGEEKRLAKAKQLIPSPGDIILSGLRQNNLSVPKDSLKLKALQANLKEGREFFELLFDVSEVKMYKRLNPPIDFRVKSDGDAITTTKATMAAVRSSLQYEAGWAGTKLKNSKDRDRSIDDALKSGKGVCFEMATICAMLLRGQGIDAYVVEGSMRKSYDKGPLKRIFSRSERFYMQNHAWVKAAIDGKEYIVDPTNTLFGESGTMRKLFTYSEREIRYLTDLKPRSGQATILS